MKHEEDFHKSKNTKDGLYPYCRACKNNIEKIGYLKNKEKRYATHLDWSRKNVDKVAEYSRRNYAKKGDRYRAYSIAYKKANPLSQEQIIKDRQSRLRYQKRNRPLFVAISARYKASKLKATPEWANDFFIQEAYELSKIREKLTGIKWHVDHIVPLQGRIVCGLHVENNLQVIPAIVNRIKGNRINT